MYAHPNQLKSHLKKHSSKGPCCLAKNSEFLQGATHSTVIAASARCCTMSTCKPVCMVPQLSVHKAAMAGREATAAGSDHTRVFADIKNPQIEKELRIVTTFRRVTKEKFWAAFQTRLSPLLSKACPLSRDTRQLRCHHPIAFTTRWCRAGAAGLRAQGLFDTL